MRRISSLCAFALLALIAVAYAQDISCKVVVITGFGAHRVYDLSNLQEVSLTPLRVVSDNQQDLYQFSICNNFDCKGSSVGVCQHDIISGATPIGGAYENHHLMGTYNEPGPLFPKSALTLSLPVVNNIGATITINCDPTATYVLFTRFDALFSLLAPIKRLGRRYEASTPF